MNFIVSFINDCVVSYFEKKFPFININYKEKSKVSRKHLENMENSKILDIWFRKIFETKFLDLFLHYCNDKEPLKELTLFERKVTLSEETKSFYYLLQKKEELKEQITYFCKLIYLDDIKGI